MNLANPLNSDLPVWKDGQGNPVSCTEKIKVLNQNFLELKQMLRDALEDGILMGCSEAMMRESFLELVSKVETDL